MRLIKLNYYLLMASLGILVAVAVLTLMLSFRYSMIQIEKIYECEKTSPDCELIAVPTTEGEK